MMRTACVNGRAGISATCAAIVACVALAGGCSSGQKAGPYMSVTDANRSSLRAEALTQEAVSLMDDDPKRAEELLREALTADLYHGPAHNNLGVLCLRQNRMYEAANEFEWARKVMPGHPDPRFNLALTLERSGRTDEALVMYDTALEVYPGHIQTVQALARLQVKAGKTDVRTEEFLNDIALRGDSDAWRKWAKELVAKAGL